MGCDVGSIATVGGGADFAGCGPGGTSNSDFKDRSRRNGNDDLRALRAARLLAGHELESA
jgi:hypothetical protein